jgi:hypothetical protein
MPESSSLDAEAVQSGTDLLMKCRDQRRDLAASLAAADRSDPDHGRRGEVDSSALIEPDAAEIVGGRPAL